MEEKGEGDGTCRFSPQLPTLQEPFLLALLVLGEVGES